MKKCFMGTPPPVYFWMTVSYCVFEEISSISIKQKKVEVEAKVKVKVEAEVNGQTFVNHILSLLS